MCPYQKLTHQTNFPPDFLLIRFKLLRNIQFRPIPNLNKNRQQTNKTITKLSKISLRLPNLPKLYKLSIRLSKFTQPFRPEMQKLGSTHVFDER